MTKRRAPYGSWLSPIGAELLASATLRFDVQLAIAGTSIFWSESRAAEGGRSVVVERRDDGSTIERTPAPFNARTRVHEYGGGAFALAADGELFFSHDDDQRIYRAREGELPRPVTAASPRRFADAVVDRARNRLIAVREDHGDDARAASAAGEAVNTIVAIDLASGVETVLAHDHDFFSTPRLSHDGRRLAWLAWDHPRMPWQGSELWVAELDPRDGLPRRPRKVAGGASESICQPEWSPDDTLHFVSDRSGWWNLYRERDGRIAPLQPMAAEFAEPHWGFGGSKYGFEADGAIVCAFEQAGRSQLARIPIDGSFAPIASPFCAIRDVRVGAGFVACLAASETEVQAVVRIDLATGERQALRRASELRLDAGDIAVAEPIRFAGSGGAATFALFYRPCNRAFEGPAGERPPLLVVSHGGPTGFTDAALRLSYQFWTSRGFAIVDVDYGGSAGHGRAYRERLDGRWGEVDVDDVVAAARFVVARGDADGERVAIRGHSAGGYTTLAALTFRDFFRAGASHYGVSDLETLARDTHKFESRYLDSLIGPWPERADLYRARSPIHHAHRMTSPLIVFQGEEDKAVPPSQAETMVQAVRATGLPLAYLLFAGEQHGFRRAATIRRVFEAELSFYGQIFGFVPAGAIEPVAIENLPGAA
ncbi:MAG TPA: prolyl oligopeptidase family serine peptidase [Caldimonas sp.]